MAVGRQHFWIVIALICRFEDYVGQLEAATAIAGLSVEKGKAPSIKDRKEISAIQEVGSHHIHDCCPFSMTNTHGGCCHTFHSAVHVAHGLLYTCSGLYVLSMRWLHSVKPSALNVFITCGEFSVAMCKVQQMCVHSL